MTYRYRWIASDAAEMFKLSEDGVDFKWESVEPSKISLGVNYLHLCFC